MRKQELGYLAGFIDGEGYIALTKRSVKSQGYGKEFFQPTIIVANTRPEVLRILQRHFGGSIMKKRLSLKSNKWKDCYRWDYRGSRISSMLRLIAPFLILKKKQANLVIRYCEVYMPHILGKGTPVSLQRIRSRIYDKLRILNRKGP